MIVSVLVIEIKEFLEVMRITFNIAQLLEDRSQAVIAAFVFPLCMSVHRLFDCPHFTQDASARGWEGAAEEGVTGKEDTGCWVT